MIQQKSARMPGLDVLRALAIVSVVACHFFLNTEFYQASFNGISMFFQGVFQFFFVSCGVPLFLLLSGYLSVFRKPDRYHYKHIINILTTYVFISVITYCCLHWGDFSFRKLIEGTLRFSAVGYAWYIEMFIGLFLLIPFLNMILLNIAENKKLVLLFIGSLFFMSSAPCFLNRYGYHILPQFWNCMWVVLYYSIGACIRLYYDQDIPAFFRKYRLLFIVSCIGLCFFNSVISIMFANGRKYIMLAGHEVCPPALFMTTVIFLLLYKTNWNNIVITSLSKYSLDIYLFSFLSDQIIYPFVKRNLWQSQSQIFLYYIPIVCSSFGMAFLFSYLKTRLFDLVKAGYGRYLTHENSDRP